MYDWLLKLGPFLLALIIYFVRLEVKLAKITTDICWIKENLTGCQQDSEEDST